MQQDIIEYNVTCHVCRDGGTVLRCPRCKATRTIDAIDKVIPKKTFRASCKCGSVIRGNLEFRSHYRKKVCLSGSYRQRKSGIRGDIVIENISLTGVGFSCLRKHDFRQRDQLEIAFNLDNFKKSEITLKVEVRNIRDKFVGVMRLDPHSFQPDLGFYLL